MAMSALLSSAEGSSPGAAKAIPMLARVTIVWCWISIGSASRRRIVSAVAVASACRSRANSSPPSRETMSPGRTARSSR
jgi:hypothetical protein